MLLNYIAVSYWLNPVSLYTTLTSRRRLMHTHTCRPAKPCITFFQIGLDHLLLYRWHIALHHILNLARKCTLHCWTNTKIHIHLYCIYSWMYIYNPFYTNIHTCIYIYMGVSENSGTPKSSILIGCSIINHPFWGTPIFGNTHYITFSIQIYILVYIPSRELTYPPKMAFWRFSFSQGGIC